MQKSYFLCCLLLYLGAIQLIEARGAGGGRVGSSGGGGGIFSGWFKSSKSSSSLPMSSSRSRSSSATSNAGVKSNGRSYTSSISRPYSGYHSMSDPSGRNGYNNDFGYQFPTLDNDPNFLAGMQISRFVNDLTQLLAMRLSHNDPEIITEETFTIKPSDILEVERSMNISAFFDLIKPIKEKIFERMGNNLANIHSVTTRVPPTTTTTHEKMKMTGQYIERTEYFKTIAEGDVAATTTTASTVLPIEKSPALPGIICVQIIENDSNEMAINKQNTKQTCFPASNSVEESSTELLKEADLAGGIQELDPQQEQQSAVDAVASESLQTVLKTLQPKEPGNIFYMPDEN